MNIQDTKTVDNKGNLLQYITEVLEKSAPDALSLSLDLPDVSSASTVSLVTIMEDAAGLNRSCDTMVRAKQQVPEASPPDRFHQVLNGQVVAAHQNACATTVESAALCHKEWTDLATFYGMDPKTATPEEFFGHITRFLEQCVARLLLLLLFFLS